jgi:tRNA (guanine-N(7)-)-methyltransferase subunit TRM82
MPKRPCAVVITPDDTTILCADKFGDVYSLPLHPLPEPTRVVPDGFQPLSTSKKFVPAANSLTVHTARNLKALKNQLRATNKPSEKAVPSFEHQLLLGHVSMLTDIACVTTDTSSSQHGKTRSYILTADRDEHIRVSRGPPQAHIIEAFCLGHKEFVSKLCIPRRLPMTLVSGGGDGLLCVWSWVEGSVLQKVDMKLLVDGYLNTYSESGRKNPTEQTRSTSEELKGSPGTRVISTEDVEENAGDRKVQRDGMIYKATNAPRLTVSGIWSVSQTDLCHLEGDGGVTRGGEILVSCEG